MAGARHLFCVRTWMSHGIAHSLAEGNCGPPMRASSSFLMLNIAIAGTPRHLDLTEHDVCRGRGLVFSFVFWCQISNPGPWVYNRHAFCPEPHSPQKAHVSKSVVYLKRRGKATNSMVTGERWGTTGRFVITCLSGVFKQACSSPLGSHHENSSFSIEKRM